MQPILPNGIALPDEDWVKAVQIIRSSSSTKATHVHLFPKQSMDTPRCCIRMEGSTYKVVSTECEDLEYITDFDLAKFEGDAELDNEYPDIVAIFENDMADSDGIIPYGLVAGEDIVSRTH